MSSIDIYRITADGEVRLLANEHNSAACVPHIWSVLNEKYAARKLHSVHHGYFTGSLVELDDPCLLDYERYCLAFCADNAWIPTQFLTSRGSAVSLASALWRFWCANGSIYHRREGGFSPIENTMARVADRLEQFANDEPGAMGVAFNATSVNQNPWLVRTNPEEGPDVDPVYRRFNFRTDNYTLWEAEFGEGRGAPQNIATNYQVAAATAAEKKRRQPR